MVVCDIGKFFHRLIQSFFCMKLVQIDAFVFQSVKISFHGGIVVGISRYPVMRMINMPDLCFYYFFLGIITRLTVFPVVVISIRADAEPPQQPADAEFPAMLFNQSISL